MAFGTGQIGATIALCYACLTASAASADLLKAEFTAPTTRYDHGILGDAVEWGALKLTLPGKVVTLTLPETRVFEDLTPRLADVDLDGDFEVIVVETSLSYGARLSIYDETGLLAATPYIGRPHRWLAPIGAADFDGDGHVEIAYIDRPHLAKTLRVWRYEGKTLIPVAEKSDLTNHQIGWDFIAGGLRVCDDGPEMITASGNWSQILSTTLDAKGDLHTTVLSDYSGVNSLETALTCP